ncbi:sugar phosphate isomerase/epimerase family protein [Salinarimonas sp. NSM]|uniref:sugar phosphate isomerase/epimerase family protein n=1 Tax=Salinarimonas sp. NSM TaxID=3458003 RepID=UPI00403590F6
MSDLRVAASTFPFLYSHSGLDALKHLASQGYSSFELMIFPPHCWPATMTLAERRAMRDWLSDNGHRVTSFCYPLLDNNPNSVCPIMRRYTLDRYKEAIAFSAELGCPYVVAIPGPVNSLINPPTPWMRDWFVEGMKELVAFAKGSGVDLLLENVPFTFLPTAKDMLEVADEIDPSIGINFDVCNSAYIKEDVQGAIRMLGSRIKNVHISDTTFADFKHDRLGTGIVEPAPAAAALKEIGYDGMTVLEIITDATQPGVDPDGDLAASHAILATSGWEAPPRR